MADAIDAWAKDKDVALSDVELGYILDRFDDGSRVAHSAPHSLG